MAQVSIGDLARVFQSRQLTTGLKTDLSRLSKELTTGLRADISTALSGDFGPIADIERLLKTSAAYDTAATEAAVVTQSMQTALEAVQENGRDLSSSLLAFRGSNNAATRQVVANNARERFDMLASTLNTHAGGRTLFGGAATDRAALSSADDMLAALKTAVAADTTAADVASSVEAWFDTPSGGFETTGYLGSTTSMGTFQMGDGDNVKPDFRADDPALRYLMKSFAMAALVAEGVLATDTGAQAELLSIAGEKMIGADQGLTTMRADLGVAQERVESASVRNAASKTSLELARNKLIATDPYDTASRLEATYSQLETFYTVTARLARLSFTDFMR